MESHQLHQHADLFGPRRHLMEDKLGFYFRDKFLEMIMRKIIYFQAVDICLGVSERPELLQCSWAWVCR